MLRHVQPRIDDDTAPIEQRRPDAENVVVKVRTANALQLWCAGRTAGETLVQVYLRSRGIRIGIPASIKFHAGLNHRTGGIRPAMIALVTGGRRHTL